MKNKGYAKFGGGKLGTLWEMCKWCISVPLCYGVLNKLHHCLD